MDNKNYKLIPMNEITDEARELAVLWVEEFKDAGGIQIQQKHKLASDIMNYAISHNQQKHPLTIDELRKELNKFEKWKIDEGYDRNRDYAQLTEYYLKQYQHETT